ncbi:MAG: hypothetical protein K2Y37_01290 [Pirellulales bacterium]|nr:hypothetical protein [Pirellulales bacterium]
MSKKKLNRKSNAAKPGAPRRKGNASQRGAQNLMVAAPLPGTAKTSTPFVLLFAEQKAVDVLSQAGCVFSELVDGLKVTGAGDSPCTTFGGSTKGDGYDSAASLR